MAFEKTPGWLDWYSGPSRPRFAVPAGAVDAREPRAVTANEVQSPRLMSPPAKLMCNRCGRM